MKKIDCLVCHSETRVLFQEKVLGKYEANYHFCPNCKCIFIPEPTWLPEAYSSAIVRSDTGIMARNELICNDLSIVLGRFPKSNIKVVDYGGGYGILTRLLRDRGIDAFWVDKFSENLLARGFEYDGESNADVFLAFEVVEHLPNPFEVIKDIMDKTNCFIFSTTTLPHTNFKSTDEWWYFAPEAGQHIFFPSPKTLLTMAERLNCSYCKIGYLHIFHRTNYFRGTNLRLKFMTFLSRIFNKIYRVMFVPWKFKSKTWDDHIWLKSKLNKE